MDVALRKQLLKQICSAGFSERQLDWLIAFQALISASNCRVDYVRLLAAAFKQPQLFCRKPDTLGGNVERSAMLLGLAKARFIAAALRQPALFYQKPETLNGNVERSAALLGVTKAQFIDAALKQPSLFCQRPETLDGNVERSAALLGLPTAQLIAAAVRQPPLFNQRPETLNGNVERSAALLGLTKAQFTNAALRQPSLFYLRPETLDGNAVRSSALLGLTKAQFIAAALKQPQLFYRKPESLGDKKPYIMKISAALDDTKSFSELIQTVPSCLTYSKRYLRARYFLAKLRLRRGRLSTLLITPTAKASALLVRHYTERIKRTGSGICALRVMQAHGLIAALPASVPAMKGSSR